MNGSEPKTLLYSTGWIEAGYSHSYIASLLIYHMNETHKLSLCAFREMYFEVIRSNYSVMLQLATENLEKDNSKDSYYPPDSDC